MFDIFTGNKDDTSVLHQIPKEKTPKLEIKQDPESKSYLCDKCDYKGQSLKHLKDHQFNIHEEHQLFPCEICGRSFKKRNLKTHMKYHVEGNPYKCDLCHYDAKSAQTLMRHKKVVHERILPHICQFCGKRFAIISNMKKHIGEFQNKIPEGSILDFSKSLTGSSPLYWPTCRSFARPLS